MILNNSLLFATSSSGILGLDVKEFVIQLITFLIVLWVLKRYALKPILKILDDRHKLIEDGVNLGEEMKVEKEKLEKEVSDKLHEARTQADSILTEAEASAKQVIAEAEDSARVKAAGLVDAAKTQIKQEMIKAKKQVEGELVDLVSDATEALVHEKVDAKRDAAIIGKVLKDRSTA